MYPNQHVYLDKQQNKLLSNLIQAWFLYSFNRSLSYCYTVYGFWRFFWYYGLPRSNKLCRLIKMDFLLLFTESRMMEQPGGAATMKLRKINDLTAAQAEELKTAYCLKQAGEKRLAYQHHVNVGSFVLWLQCCCSLLHSWLSYAALRRKETKRWKSASKTIESKNK